MIYAVTYEIEGFCGQSGYINTSQADVVDHSINMAEISIDIFGDSLDCDWVNLNEDPVNPVMICQKGSMEERLNIVIQLSEEMQGQNKGYFNFWEYDDIFSLIEEQNVLSWCSESMKKQIKLLSKNYGTLVDELSEEWSAF